MITSREGIIQYTIKGSRRLQMKKTRMKVIYVRSRGSDIQTLFQTTQNNKRITENILPALSPSDFVSILEQTGVDHVSARSWRVLYFRLDT